MSLPPIPRELRNWLLGVSRDALGWMEKVSRFGHSLLQGVEQADDTNASTAGGKHVTDALVKAYKDHTLDAGIHRTVEEAQDLVAALLVNGNAVTLTYNDAANTLTVAVNKVAASANATTTVTGTAGETYTGIEEAMINALKTDVVALAANLNDLKTKMRTAGHLA